MLSRLSHHKSLVAYTEQRVNFGCYTLVLVLM